VGEQILTLLPILGAVSLAIACALWAAASNAEARRLQAALRARLREREGKLEQSEAVLASDPGLILIWGEAEGQAASLPLPTAELPRGAVPMTPNLITGDLEAVLGKTDRNPAEQFRTFLARLAPEALRGFAEQLESLRGRGTPFSMVARRKDRGEFEITGQTIGPRAVVRVRDVTGAVREVARLSNLLESTEDTAQGLTAFMDALPLPLWRRDEAGKLTWVNAAYAAAVGAQSPEEVVEQGIEIDERSAMLARQVTEDGMPVRERLKAVLSGEARAVDLMALPVPGGSAGLALDRTEADQFATALGDQQSANNRVLDGLATAVAMFDADRRLRYANAAFASLWDLDESWLATRPSHSEILERLREARRIPEHRDFRAWKESRMELYTTVTTAREEDWPLPDGRMLRLVCRPHPKGGLIFLYEDVSDRVALESQYNTLIEVQRKTLDNLDEGIAVFGTDGRLELHNESFEKLWHLSPAQLEGRPHVNEVITLCKDLFDEEDDWRAIRSRTTGGEEGRTSIQRRIDRRDGTILQFAVQPLRSGQTLVTFLDLTAAANVERALREKNDALEAADRLKSAFVENVSYQLRNPLNPILGFSEMLESGIAGDLNEQQSTYVHNVVEGATQLRDLIDDILDLAMIEAGTLTLDASEVEVRDLLESAAQMRVSRINDSAVALDLKVDEDAGTIYADEKRLRQVLFNLLSNASRFTGEGGRIELGAKREGSHVTFWVADTGTGIDEDAQMHAFDSFASDGTPGAGKRPGLGLALVKSFVELHGGWVSLESEPGEGTKVSFVVPVRAPDTKAA